MVVWRRRDFVTMGIVVGLAAAVAVSGQEAPAGSPSGRVAGATSGRVSDFAGNVMVRRGARTFAVTRGNELLPGDQIFVLDGGSLTIVCADQKTVRVLPGNAFTYSGCEPANAATVAATPTQPAVQSPAGAVERSQASVAPAASQTTAPSGAIATPSSGSGHGVLLGVLGGVALLGAAAGGGGGGGGGGGSAPASP